jgi:ATP-dependent Clp protease adaptor protein ClpS
MEFVIFLLLQIFHKTMEEATEITLQVHNKNAATVGVYTHEIAENKMNITVNTARQEGFPLNVSIEEEE